MPGPAPSRPSARRRLAPLLLSACLPLTQDSQIPSSAAPELFAGLITVALSDSVSAATFRVDNGSALADDTDFSTFRVPWHRDVDVGSRLGTLRLEAAGGVLVADDGLHVPTASGLATVDIDWLVYGAQAGVGWSFALGDRWSVGPGVVVGLGRVENTATYNEAGRIELAPLLDDFGVNWSSWVALGAVQVSLARALDPTRFSTGLDARYAMTRTRSFEASQSFQEGTARSQFFVARGRAGAPTRMSWNGETASWDGYVGYVGLHGIPDSTLGFDAFVDTGLGLTFRLSRHLPRVRLGAAWLAGPDLRGWSVGLSL